MIILVLSLLVTTVTPKEMSDLSKGGIEDISGSMKGHVIKKSSLAHQDVKLDCQRPNMPELSSDSTFSWVFFPTSHNAQDGKEPIIYTLCGATGQSPCERRLVLQKVNSSSSGLYKCSIVSQKGVGFVMTSTPVSTFNLEVRDEDPKFIEGPKNINVYEDTSATLTCRVQSEVPMTIKWFKRDKYPLPNATVIHYNNNTYRPLRNFENHHEGNIYTSDLVFHKVYKNDSGVYACSFLSPTGQILYQEGSISVHQTLVIFSSLVQEKWEIFAAVLVVVILVIVTVGCMIILCLKKLWEKNDDPPLNMRRKLSRGGETDGNETSEYEHVVL